MLDAPRADPGHWSSGLQHEAAQRKSGRIAKLAFQALALVAEIRSAGGAALAIQADSADPEAVRAAVETAVAEFGKFGVLVVNAGILIGGQIDQFSLTDFDRMVAVNVRLVAWLAGPDARYMSGASLTIDGAWTA